MTHPDQTVRVRLFTPAETAQRALDVWDRYGGNATTPMLVKQANAMAEAMRGLLAAAPSPEAEGAAFNSETVDTVAWIIDHEAQNIDGAMLSWAACERIAKAILAFLQHPHRLVEADEIIQQFVTRIMMERRCNNLAVNVAQPIMERAQAYLQRPQTPPMLPGVETLGPSAAFGANVRTEPTPDSGLQARKGAA